MNFELINIVNNISDKNGIGSIPYEYYMSQFPISNSDYCEFLNSIPNKSVFHFDTVLLPDQGINFQRTNNKLTFYVKSGYEDMPVTYISYNNSIQYISWLNKKTINTTSIYSYQNNSEYWLPSYNEWYKAAYFDGKSNYYNFPLQTNYVNITNNINKYSFNSNYILNKISNNGLFNLNYTYFNTKDMAGNVYEFLRDDDDNTSCQIAGSSWNRSFMNSFKGFFRHINKQVYNNYIGIRLCKKCPARLFKIALYNNFGDGWTGSFLSISDTSGGKLLDRVRLAEGCGPQFFDFLVFSQKMIIVEYNSTSDFFYDHYYEIYDDHTNKLYRSRPFKGNNNKQVVII